MKKKVIERVLSRIMAVMANYVVEKRREQFFGGPDNVVWAKICSDEGVRKRVGDLLVSMLDGGVEVSPPSAVAPAVIEVMEPSPAPKITSLTDRLAPVRAQILPPDRQIAAWVEACPTFRRFGYLISDVEIDLLCHECALKAIPTLTPEAMEDGYLGPVLSYGFGGNGTVSDMVMSAQVPWEYIASTRAVWKSDYIDFGNPKSIRPFSRKHSERPVGFYWRLVQLGHAHQNKPVEKARSLISPSDWGMGPEGVQFFLTHPHYAEMMDGDLYPFIDLSDFEVASGASGVFSDAPYLGFNRDTGELDLGSDDVSNPDPSSGSGSLR